MPTGAYYNEIEPYAAEWLKNLISKGLVAPGDVDTRSIVDVRPSDLIGYTQCHFFAGIGLWSLALRVAGWPDDRPVWTGSCPCQPFSVAGRGAGFSDERHLWPVWFRLIAECRPPVVFGEQVEAAVRLDAIFADLEGKDYACGAAVLGAHSVGAPHIRQRLWFVADAGRERYDGLDALLRQETYGWIGTTDPSETSRRREAGALADTADAGLVGRWAGQASDGRDPSRIEPERLRNACFVGDTGRQYDEYFAGGISTPQGADGRGRDHGSVGSSTASFWSDAEWLPCRDGKARPVEPGTFPLAHGAPARVGRLRAYGNAIVPQVAAEVIRAYLDARP